MIFLLINCVTGSYKAYVQLAEVLIIMLMVAVQIIVLKSRPQTHLSSSNQTKLLINCKSNSRVGPSSILGTLSGDEMFVGRSDRLCVSDSTMCLVRMVSSIRRSIISLDTWCNTRVFLLSTRTFIVLILC